MQDFGTRNRLAQTAMERARRNYYRAQTVHENAQARGEYDMSVEQTRRMALAVASLQRAYHRYAVTRDLFQGN